MFSCEIFNLILQRDTSKDGSEINENDQLQSLSQKHRRDQWMEFLEISRHLTIVKLCNIIQQMN